MKDDLFNELIESVHEGGAILRGEKPASRSFHVDKADVQNIRASYNLSQSAFARMMGISVGTLKNWEQGRRTPQGPARVLLQIAAAHPEAVLDVVHPESNDSNKIKKQPRHTIKN